MAGLALAVTFLVGVAPAHATPSVVDATGPLSDLSPAANATDGGHGRLYAIAPGDGSTYFVLVLTGLDPRAAGSTYGAHVHIGPCVAGNGAAALGHYNTGTGGKPSPENEVWLDFTVLPGGYAVARTTVPFEIAPGTAKSVVGPRRRHPARDGSRRRAHRLPARPVLTGSGAPKEKRTSDEHHCRPKERGGSSGGCAGGALRRGRRHGRSVRASPRRVRDRLGHQPDL